MTPTESLPRADAVLSGAKPQALVVACTLDELDHSSDLATLCCAIGGIDERRA